MLRFQVTEDEKWIALMDFSDDVERKQIEISLTQKIHNFYFHPLVKKKIWDGSVYFFG